MNPEHGPTFSGAAGVGQQDSTHPASPSSGRADQPTKRQGYRTPHVSDCDESEETGQETPGNGPQTLSSAASFSDHNSVAAKKGGRRCDPSGSDSDEVRDRTPRVRRAWRGRTFEVPDKEGFVPSMDWSYDKEASPGLRSATREAGRDPAQDGIRS